MERLVQSKYTINSTPKVDLLQPSHSDSLLVYDVNYVDHQRPQGKTSLYFKKLERLNQELRLEESLFSVLSELGVQPQDTVTRIEEFYPYGEGLTEEELKKYSRHGLGTILLKFAEMDSKQENAKATYIVSETDSGTSFFRKKGLEELSVPSSNYKLFYKLL